MRIKDLTEDGVIVPGVNTTVDVKPGQTEKEAAKFFGHGKPKELHAKARKNSDPNTLYNMGLAESVELDEGLGKLLQVAVQKLGPKVLTNPKVIKALRWLTKNRNDVPTDAYNNIIDYALTAGGAAAGAYAATRRNNKDNEDQDLKEFFKKNKGVKQSDPLRVLDNIADRKDNKEFPIKMYDGSTIGVRPSTARRIITIYLQSEDDVRTRIEQALKTKNGFKELLMKVETIEFDDNILAEAWSNKYKRSIDCSNPKGFSQKAHCASKKKNETTNQYVLTPHQNLPNTKSMTGGTTMVTKSFKKMQQQQSNTQAAVDARQGAGMSRIGTAPKIKQSDFSPEVFPQRTGIKKPRY